MYRHISHISMPNNRCNMVNSIAQSTENLISHASDLQCVISFVFQCLDYIVIHNHKGENKSVFACKINFGLLWGQPVGSLTGEMPT